MKPIITEDEIKEFVKNECIKIIATIDLRWKKKFDYGNYHYDQNRNDGFRTIKVNRDE